jgi:PTH2 family peptidyl-tRNA hydrolase
MADANNLKQYAAIAAAFAVGVAVGWMSATRLLKKSQIILATPASTLSPNTDALKDRSATLDAPMLYDEDSNVVPDDVELKMVLAVRQDLNMSKGKIAAQVGHAVLACWQASQSKGEWKEWAKAWNFRAAAKITLKVDDEAKLEEIARAAEKAGLPCCIIEDAGRTEIPEGSRTVLGIGPAPKALIDKITGPKGSHPLKLLT